MGNHKNNFFKIWKFQILPFSGIKLPRLEQDLYVLPHVQEVRLLSKMLDPIFSYHYVMCQKQCEDPTCALTFVNPFEANIAITRNSFFYMMATLSHFGWG